MKLTRKKGFTLAEMLIAVLLLGFVTLMAGVMTSAVLDTTVTMEEVAQAEVLGNEALENIQSELRFGTNVTLKDKKVTYDRNMTPNGGNTIIYRKGCTIDLNEEGMLVIKYKEKDETEEKTDTLFGGASYGKNLKITTLEFKSGKMSETVNNTGEGAVTVDKNVLTVTIKISFGDDVIWSGSASVKPLNGKITIES